MSIHEYGWAFTHHLASGYAFAFWKGRAALYAILKALDIKSGDEIILPAFTCVVVPNTILAAGARPVYVDIKPDDYNIDLEQIERAITSRTRAIIVQHTFGLPAAVDRICEIAAERGVFVIEDCAHALGTTYLGKPLGTFGNAAFFSSQWSKPYSTGLGGIAFTVHKDLANNIETFQATCPEPPLLRRLALALQYSSYEKFYSPSLFWKARGALHRLSRIGIAVGSSSESDLNGALPRDLHWRMSAFQAKQGLRQLSVIQQNIRHRQSLARFYRGRLEEAGWPTSARLDGGTELTLLRYPLRVSNKWELLARAEEQSIELGSWFESPLHPNRPPFDVFGYSAGSCPNGERASQEVVNLPLHSKITPSEAERILEFLFRYGEKVKTVRRGKMGRELKVECMRE